jgi:hypothetical protein
MSLNLTRKGIRHKIELGVSRIAAAVGLVLRGKRPACISAALVANLAVLLRCFTDADYTELTMRGKSMSTNTTNDKNIPEDPESYYEALASQEEIYLEETEEELRVMLSSKDSAPSESNSLTIDSAAGVVEENRDHAAEELITGDSDDPPLSESTIAEMLRKTQNG